MVFAPGTAHKVRELKRLMKLKGKRNKEQELLMMKLVKELLDNDKLRKKTMNLLAIGYGKNEIGSSILGPSTGIILGPKLGYVAGNLNLNRLEQLYQEKIREKEMDKEFLRNKHAVMLHMDESIKNLQQELTGSIAPVPGKVRDPNNPY